MYWKYASQFNRMLQCLGHNKKQRKNLTAFDIWYHVRLEGFLCTCFKTVVINYSANFVYVLEESIQPLTVFRSFPSPEIFYNVILLSFSSHLPTHLLLLSLSVALVDDQHESKLLYWNKFVWFLLWRQRQLICPLKVMIKYLLVVALRKSRLKLNNNTEFLALCQFNLLV